MNPRPASITLNRKTDSLEIEWRDGVLSRYPLSHLREACPCVECRGGHGKMGMEYAPDDILTLKPRRSYAMTSLEPVGNYALQPTWDDGHHTGIYTWQYLRKIAPED